VDRVRKQVSPNKIRWKQWAGVMKDAHNLGMPTTATMMFGSIETDKEIVEHLVRLRAIQDETHGFTAFPGHSRAIRNSAVVGYCRRLKVPGFPARQFHNIKLWVFKGRK
jgi:cyclic dehypoxanthinyl futalosine synthase